MWRTLILLPVLALAVSACGRPGPKVYDATKTRACLVAHKAVLGPPPASDFVASTALGGSFKVTLHKNFVTVSFGNTIDNGKSLDQVYRNVHASNVGINDVLRMQGNTVMLWHAHPSDDDLSFVQDCLTS